MNLTTSASTKRFAGLLLAGTMLTGVAVPAQAQVQSTPEAAPAPDTAQQATLIQAGRIRSISVSGAQRLEPQTVVAYANLQAGQTYTAETLDQALKDLYATELFADVVINGADTGDLVIQIKENPVINRIVLEGNKKLKDDKIQPEIRLSPRQIFTASRARADVDRIIELYKREGRFAATVEPKIVKLDQNRVDVVFEIHEGDKSKVRAINIIGNTKFTDGRLQKEMYTKEAGGLLGLFKSNDSYDPDRLAADQQKLRAFYLTQGYADFRVVSALAELTPDRKDFVITYVVEEGARYKIDSVKTESDLRDFGDAEMTKVIPIKSGDWFNAKLVEDTVNALNEIAGAKGYAFAQIEPSYSRDVEKHTMGLTFQAQESPRVYVERIDITGNTITRDKVIRREFRINEGDAFNALKVKRSQDRLKSLGYFDDKLEIKQSQGSARDRVVLTTDVTEKSTGQLQLSAGYSSLEKVIFSGGITQSNFMGKGQVANVQVDWSRYSRSAQLSFTEPQLFDKPIALGGDLFRRDYSSFSYQGDKRNTTYSQVSTGGGIRTGFPLTEYASASLRYTLVADKITLNPDTFYTDPDGTAGPLAPKCDPLKAGKYLCDELGTRITSLVGMTLAFDNTNGIRPTRGQRIIVTEDFAGLGGDVKYLRNRIQASKYKGLPAGFVGSISLEAGTIIPFGAEPASGADRVRISDRFYGGQIRGFDIRGIGPRILRTRYDSTGALLGESETTSDALGGHNFYHGRLEVEFPTNAGLRSLGLRPSAYVEAASVWGLKKPDTNDYLAYCAPNAGNTNPGKYIYPGDTPITCPDSTYTRINGVKEEFVGNSAKPRVAVGVGVNWNSPFGPLRLDVAKALVKQKGDDPKFFTFNVGTSF